MKKLKWDQVSENEWHAGGLRRHFEMHRTPDVKKATFHHEHFSLYVREGDEAPRYVASYLTRGPCEARAEILAST